MGKLNRSNFNDSVNVELDTIATIQENIGNVSDLETENKDLVSAINEVKTIGNNVKQELVSSLLSVDSSLPITNVSTWDEVNESITNIQAGTGINGIIKQYEIQAGENISAGDFVRFASTGNAVTAGTPVVFESASSSYISAIRLTDTKVLVAYRDGSNSNYGTVVILTIDGTTITAGTPVLFQNSRADFISATAINENKALIAFQDYTNSRYGKAVVLTIDGMSIAVESSIIFNSSVTNYIAVTPALTENKVLVTYSDNGNSSRGTAIVLSIDGATITAGTPVVFETGNSQYLSAVKLNENKVVVAYQDYTSSGYGTAVVLTVDGTTITAGTPAVFEGANTNYISAATLTENKVLVAYCDISNQFRGTAAVLSINESSITSSTPITFNTAKTQYVSVTRLNNYKALVSYQDSTNNVTGTSIVLSIEDTIITAGTRVVYKNDTIEYNALVTLDENNVLSAYQDMGNNGYGTSIILGTDVKTFIKKAISNQVINGVAQQSGTAGQTIEVVTL